MALTSGFAQTENTPASQSAPADQSSPQNGATSGTASTTTDQNAMPTAHHHRHHMRTASSESRSERRTTNDLNKQQLAQAEAADQQGPQMAQGSSPANASYQGNGANAPSMEISGSAPAPSRTDSNVGPTSEPDKNADTVNAPSQQHADNAGTNSSQTAMAENASSGTQNMSAASTPQSGPMPVTQVQNAQQTLASAKVQGEGGKPIGTVQAITRDPDGTPTKVQVELDQSLGMGKRSVWIDADQLKYEPRDNAVTTNLSPDQLSTM